MGEVISVHEYILKPGLDEVKFEQAIEKARVDGVLRLPGLVGFRFLKGIKGHRKGLYAGIWIYESRVSWEKLWGKSGQPRKKEDYPENWQVWENEVLAPFLDQDPDSILFTAYEEIE